MATTKSMKIQAEIDKVKAKISEQQARLKELEKNKQEAENSEIVDIVRGMSISLADLPQLLQTLKSGTLGQSVPKSETTKTEDNGIWRAFCQGRIYLLLKIRAALDLFQSRPRLVIRMDRSHNKHRYEDECCQG